MRALCQPRLAARLAAGIVLAAAGVAHAAKVPMSDAELSGVSGQGVAILVHLELNAGLLTGAPIDSRFYAGFDKARAKTRQRGSSKT